MPNWENIEDVRSNPPKVWLTRVKEIDDWKPLRKCDCFALNNNENNDNVNKRSTITIEEGRATADKERGIVTANFHRAPDRSLCSAFWFVKKDSGSNENKSKNLEPVSNEVDTKKIETLYQMAVEASGSFGQGVETILKEEVELEDGSKVFLSLTVRVFLILKYVIFSIIIIIFGPCLRRILPIFLYLTLSYRICCFSSFLVGWRLHLVLKKETAQLVV